MGHGPVVLLASQSPYRRELLGRLLDTFESFTPRVDESPLPGEEPGATGAAAGTAESRCRCGTCAGSRGHWQRPGRGPRDTDTG